MVKEHNGIKYKFFWSGPFSNWHRSNFTVNGYVYNCGEQFMMHQKALLFNDKIIANQIMKETNPKQQKSLGRKVSGFNSIEWDKVKYDLIKSGLKEKFTQNKDLRELLLSHKDHQLVEASPYDRIWGIGFIDKDAIKYIDKWGENLLGKILSELSKEI